MFSIILLVRISYHLILMTLFHVKWRILPIPFQFSFHFFKLISHSMSLHFTSQILQVHSISNTVDTTINHTLQTRNCNIFIVNIWRFKQKYWYSHGSYFQHHAILKLFDWQMDQCTIHALYWHTKTTYGYDNYKRKQIMFLKMYFIMVILNWVCFC